jgi:hypothetical protein
MLEKDSKAKRERFQDPQRRVFWAANLGGRQSAGEMRLYGRMSRAKRALFFWLRPARWATNGQYLSQRQVFGLHTDIVQHRQLKRWSILL